MEEKSEASGEYDFPKNVERDGPVEVSFAIYINSIYNVDSVNETYQISFELMFEWSDDRVAYRDESEPIESNYAWKKKPGVDWEKTWHPKLHIIDLIDSVESENQKEVISRNGKPKVTWWLHMKATVGSPLELADFPYDTQTLHLNWRSSWYHARQVKFVPSEQQRSSLNTNVNPKMRLNEYILKDVKCETGVHIYPMLQELEGEENGIFDNFKISFILQRRPDYYIAKIVSLFYCILLMAGGSFFIDLTATGDRMGITVTLFLTAVAFQFVIEGNLPKISYRTRMDVLVSTNYFWLLFSFVENILMFQLSSSVTSSQLWNINAGCATVYYVGGSLGYVWFLFPSITKFGKSETDFRSHLSEASTPAKETGVNSFTSEAIPLT